MQVFPVSTIDAESSAHYSEHILLHLNVDFTIWMYLLYVVTIL